MRKRGSKRGELKDKQKAMDNIRKNRVVRSGHKGLIK